MFSRTAVEASVRHCLQIFSAFLLFTLQTNVHAQSSSVIFDHFATDQGKFSPIVRSILQDRLGFLWFATYGGLDRYDGNIFVSYKHDPADRYSIDNSWGLSLCEDTKGFLWVGTWRGLEKFDRATEKFYHFIPHPGTDTEWGNVVFAVHEDREGVLWVGTGDGLYYCNRPNDTTVTFEKAMEDSARPMNKTVRAIAEDRLGRLWVASESNLMELDRVSRRFVCRWRLPDRPNGETEPAKISQHWIFAIHEDHEGTLWLATNGGLVRYDVDPGTSLIYRHHPHQQGSLNDNGVLAVGEDAVGQIWAGTDYGLDRLDRATGTFTTFRHSDKYLSGLRANGIYQIFSERSGTLWISTRGGGVGRLNLKRPLFTSYSQLEKGSGNFTGGLVEMASGTIWANTYFNGMEEFDPRKGTFKHFGPRTALHILAKGTGNSVWIAPDNGGLGMGLLERNGSVIPFNDSFGRASSNMVDGMCHSQHGFYWVVTDHGLCKMEPKTRSFTYVGQRQLPPRFMNVFEDATGVVWIGTMELGLYSYEPANDSFTHFAYDWKNPGTISGNTIAGVIEDTTAGVLWLATTFGLNKFDKHTRMFTRFTSKNGLPHDNILAVLMDDHGNLWLSTLGGITRFDTRTNTCRNFDESDGLPNGRFSYRDALKTRNGEMYFGSSGGLVRFHPDSIRESSYVPPIVITAFRKSDTLAVLDSAISEKKVIELSYKDRVFAFEFSALNYLHPEKNQYAYKLEGFDPEWNYCGTRRTATYTNLDGGDYIFRVKGSNNDGIWNEEGTSIAITITPPWWKTLWAYGAYVMLIASILYGVYRVRVSRLHLSHQLQLKHLEAEKMHDVDRMKSRFFANISHEFRTPLTLILGPSESIASATKDEGIKERAGVIKRNAQRLLHLVNQLLDLSRFEAGQMKLRAQQTDLAEMINGIAASFESMAERKNIRYTSMRPSGPLIGWFDRDAVEKILTNLLSNAFKYTPEGGTIALSADATSRQDGESPQQWIEIKVSDTGIGIPSTHLEKIFDRFYQVDDSHTREHEGVGIGLALTKELVELHRGAIFVQSEIGKGSTFNVRLPLGKGHLKPEEIVEEPPDTAHVSDPYVEEESDVVPQEQDEVATDEQQPLLLVIEDNADMRRYIASHLQESYRILDATHGVEGLEKAIEAIPDLVISDVMMPQMDGFEVCKRLKTDERTSHIPIILLTAKAGPENKIEGLESGADDYLTKPFDAKELAVRVKNLIEQRRRLRERFRSTVVIKPSELAVTSADERFLTRAISIVEKHIAESEFSTESMAEELALSRMQLHRKLKALTGKSPHLFMRMLRLHRAAELLQKKAGNVSEVAYDVGFNNLSHFARAFKEEFGKNPSEYEARGE